MSHEKLKVAVARLNELRYRLEPVEQHWAWTAEQLHRELRHALHTLNGVVSYLSSGDDGIPDTTHPAGADSTRPCPAPSDS